MKQIGGLIDREEMALGWGLKVDGRHIVAITSPLNIFSPYGQPSRLPVVVNALLRASGIVGSQGQTASQETVRMSPLIGAKQVP